MAERADEARSEIFQTEISQLDALLKEGGIVVPDKQDGISILLKGSAGAGKSTLALLLAAKCAKDGGPCLYCALEQSDYSLKRLARSLNVDEEGWCWLSESDEPPQVESMTGFVCVTALRRREPDFYGYLNEVAEQAGRYVGTYGTEKRSMVLIDSLNVFGPDPVSRLEFERLKGELSSKNRILVFVGEPEEAQPEVWDRLVDMVIELGSKTPLDYFLRTIRISKARFQNHILGSHVSINGAIIMPKRSVGAEPKADQPSDCGFFIYPSLHYHLSVAIERKRRLEERGRDQEDRDRSQEDARLLKTGFEALYKALGGGVKRSTMTAISSDLSYAAKGIGLSFLAQGVEDGDRGLYLSLQDDPESITKLPSPSEHGLSTMVEEGKLVITSYRPGFISAEEFVDKIIRQILDPSGLNARFQRVVFDDVSQIGLRFPLLELAPVFLPTLMDIFKLYDMTALFLSAWMPSETSDVGPTRANLNDLASTVMEVKRVGVKSENEALVRIRKIAEQFYVPQPLKLSIDREVGGRIRITE